MANQQRGGERQKVFFMKSSDWQVWSKGLHGKRSENASQAFGFSFFEEIQTKRVLLIETQHTWLINPIRKRKYQVLYPEFTISVVIEHFLFLIQTFIFYSGTQQSASRRHYCTLGFFSMGESSIRMIHLLLSLSETNGQQNISLKNTQHYERRFNFDRDRAFLEDYSTRAL